MKHAILPVLPAFPDTSSASSVVDITDPTTVGAGLEVITQDALHLATGAFRSRRAVIHLGKFVVVYQSTNQPTRTRSTLQDGLVAYVTFGPSATGTLNGFSIGPDRILACKSAAKVEFIVAPGYESVSVLVPPDDLRAYMQLRQRNDHSLMPRGVELLRTSPGAGRRLFAWGRRLADAAAMQHGVFDSPLTNALAEHECFEMLLSSIESTTKAERGRHDATRHAYSRVVQIAEDYVLNHTEEPIYLALLCKEASVSERTLQNAFKGIMGMTPIAYLTRIRLYQVRRALLAATPNSTTVRSEAVKAGFWHLGDFSSAYKKCFGELPSITLRRGT